MSRKFKFNENLKRITGTLHEYLCTFMIISHRIFLRVRKISDESYRENQGKNFIVTFFFENRAVCIEKYCRAGQATDDNTTHGHYVLETQGYRFPLRICNNYFFLRQQWLCKSAIILLDTYSACLALSKHPARR